MKISKAIEALELLQLEEGDLEIESLIDFWVHTEPRTGERTVIPSAINKNSIMSAITIINSTRRFRH